MAEPRDYAGEVAGAIETGDMRTLQRLAVLMAGELASIHAKRKKERGRKARNSAPVAENLGLPLGSPSLPSPTPPTNSSSPSAPPTPPGSDRKSSGVVGAIVPDYTAYAIGLATAANKANAERFGQITQPIVWSNGHSVALATELLELGVPLELARSVIADVIARAKNRTEPFKNLAYFRAPIIEAHDAEKQKTHDANASAPGPAPSGSAPRGKVNPGEASYANTKAALEGL